MFYTLSYVIVYIPDSTSIDGLKMQAKSVILKQWKLINQLKIYFSKFAHDSNIENVLNKEFAKFLQKIDPKIYGNDFVQQFSSTISVDNSQEKSDAKGIDKDKGGISFPNIFSNMWKEETKSVTIPKWKTEKPAVSKELVAARTKSIVSSLALAESDKWRLYELENLITHLKQYPEAKHCAVKEGAIRLLLRLSYKGKKKSIQGPLNEALSLIGHAHPVRGEGIRILSIDGGGTRGILVIEMLRKLEELSGKPAYEMFDMICGVSTGAIIGALIGLKQHTLDETTEIYRSISSRVFTQSTLKGTSSLVWSHSYYDTELWEKLLQEQMDSTLIQTARNSKTPKYCAVSAVVNHPRLAAYVFRNYSLPYNVQSQYMGGYDHQVWEAVRASAAAPTYFEEFKIGNMILQDGGILVNNPTAVAIHEAKLLWPTTPIQCVVSFGTGRTVPNPIEIKVPTNNNTSWKHKFLAILDSATDTEGVHTMLSDLLPEGVYYRFNPYLTEMLEMSEIDPVKLEQLKRDAIMYLRRNEDKFQYAIKKLSVRRNYVQKSMDWINVQKQIYA
ncbi:calcium-independent phospholipase A2-gamma-like isoform X2 [Sitophilus oryzae]|uniref:Calcium-independent phospholipase A2-gamma-like isoform X2 n=1 Tax=Sitophilus oryzae TaxID=7048 RepID=A0A6J2XR60_SITOR|nr:calcium-independent phospholipase A2-gamma-like isoform X2 [Sitophilus oryzae]